MLSSSLCTIVFASLSIAYAIPDSIPTFPLQQLSPDVILEAPKPYQFGYDSADGFGTKQHRRESSDVSGAVTGSYGYVDPFGVYRNVEYIADVGGYRATVHSNEPGMASKNVADAAYFVEAPPPAVVAQGLAYLSNQLNPKILV